MKNKLLLFLIVLLILPISLFAQRSTGNRSSNYDLTVQSNVKGVMIRVRGNGVNESSSSNNVFTLESGNYSVEVSANGYQTQTVDVNLNQDRTITVNLSPVTYSLRVRSNTPGALVQITGNGVNESGRADYSANLGQGTYTVTVTADGYETESQQVNMNRNQNVTMNLNPSRGTVTIFIAGSSINPKDVNARSLIEIYDNGELLPAGEMTWQLRPGQHTIQIVSGGLMAQTTINVRPGQTYVLEPDFSISVR